VFPVNECYFFISWQITSWQLIPYGINSHKNRYNKLQWRFSDNFNSFFKVNPYIVVNKVIQAIIITQTNTETLYGRRLNPV
jgi:hypothetical protein